VIGSFAVVTVVGGPGDTRHDLGYYRGLAARRPWLAGSLAVLLVAQAGVPFTTGFLAKLEVISASVGARSTPLAVIAMVSAAIAAFFYLRVILVMYAPAEATSGVAVGGDGGVVMAVGSVEGSVGAVDLAAPPDRGGALLTAPGDEPADPPTPVGVGLAISICVVVTVLFGIWPAPIVDFAHRATLLFS
jgi:NADH-quinone oxidoreductase subunit N